MDIPENRAELENQQAVLEAYLQHPVTVEVLRDLKEQQDGMTEVITMPVVSIETFFAHFEAVGTLRGLRRSEAVLQSSLETIKEKIKEQNYDR